MSENQKAVCWGTKECEECGCNGDQTKCTFYPEVREKSNSAPSVFNVIVNSKIDYLVNDRIYEVGEIIKVNELDGFSNNYAHYYTKRVDNDRIQMLDWIPKHMVSIIKI